MEMTSHQKSPEKIVVEIIDVLAGKVQEKNSEIEIGRRLVFHRGESKRSQPEPGL
jgi:hypothetical protein